jgi:hypothetical protein
VAHGPVGIIGGVLGAIFFVLFILGGAVYRSECVRGNGRNETSWGIGEVVPYTSNTKSGCETHTLTRYVLGKIGVASDVQRRSYHSDMIAEIGAGSAALPAVYSTVRSSGEFSSGFSKHFDAYMSHFAMDAVWDSRVGTRLEGITAIRSYTEEFNGSVEGFRGELLEVVDLGGGAMLTTARQGGRPGGSASELIEHVAFVSVLVDGLVESMATYSDIDEARAAAGRLAEGRV